MATVDRMGAPSTTGTTVKVFCAGVLVAVAVNMRGETVCTRCGKVVRVVT